ncbi:MAG TPA: 50S ribosomal protein L3 [Methanomicrobia archaeon]|nr:50S ribosomal protein L3 [Methanomicrobia archaeon]
MGTSSGKGHRPRRGSLAYSPRKRAKRIYPRIGSWPKIEDCKLLDFPGYKAGMTHILKIDDRKHAITKGKEVQIPATIVETPPIYIAGVRFYRDGKVLTEIWADVTKDMERKICKPKKKRDVKIDDLDPDDVRVIASTVPRKVGIKKKPEIMEIGVGGKSIEERVKYCMSILGKEISVKDVFRDGEYIDVVAVTKGKGFQGQVKRWGVKIQNRKTNDARRHVGSIGPWKPRRTMWTVPMAGQMGYQTRTEYNKRILKIDSEDITPKGGFLNYGVLRNEYVIVKGSIPGSKKRLVRMRVAIRKPIHAPEGAPQITFISTKSQQGV